MGIWGRMRLPLPIQADRNTRYEQENQKKDAYQGNQVKRQGAVHAEHDDEKNDPKERNGKREAQRIGHVKITNGVPVTTGERHADNHEHGQKPYAEKEHPPFAFWRPPRIPGEMGHDKG